VEEAEEDVAVVVVLVVVVAVAMVVVVGVAVDLRDLHLQVVVQVPKHSKQHWLAQQVDVDVEVVVERVEAEAPRQPVEVVAEMLANRNKLNRCPPDDGHTTSSLAQNQPEVDNNKSNLDEH